MTYTKYLLAAASLLAVTTPAMAQSTDDPFTGFRIEGVGGYDQSRAGSSVDDEGNEDNDQSIEGVVYGVNAGYDFNAGGLVLGIEGELTDSTAETEFEEGDFEGFGLGNVETGRDIYVGARVGVQAAPRTLLYAKGGYTNARYNLNSSFDGDDFRSAIEADGYRVGAGIEQAFGSNAYAKIEYRYSNYSEADLEIDDGDTVDLDLGQIDTDRHQVVAGVGLRF